ncbi:hypothetical protein SGM_3624 [Streptomyces griseoaurantiacus M045]|uniref:Uncharacterized protein n=1 Tax=Streptomyces griseoaurantiacus M045 TaxID=996637 RepID=F3NKG0_9ACTN|nr:hypothetical protein SGM_3624 [Streptomyces griseoaurantiacus M045]
MPTAGAILPTAPQRVTRGSLSAEALPSARDEAEVARGWGQCRPGARCALARRAQDPHDSSAPPTSPAACRRTRRTPERTPHSAPSPFSYASSVRLLTETVVLSGQQGHERVPARDLAPVGAVVRGVDGPPGPGPGDAGGGGPAVLHGAQRVGRHGREGVTPPGGPAVQHRAGPAGVGMTAASGVAAQQIRPVGATRLPDGHGEPVPADAVMGVRGHRPGGETAQGDGAGQQRAPPGEKGGGRGAGEA